MAKIQKLKDYQNTDIYPVTHERAVYDSSGVKLEDKMNDVLVRTYTELTPTAVESKAFEPDGSIIDSTSTTLKTFSVTGGNEYAFSWYAAKTYTRYAIAWYDANSTYISKESYKGNNSSSVTYTKKIVKAPTGAAYAKMNISNSFVSRAILYSVTTLKQQNIYENTVFKTDIVDALDSTATDQPLSAKQGKVLSDAISGSQRSASEYIELPVGTLYENTEFRNTSEQTYSTDKFDLKQYAVTPDQKYYLNGYMAARYDLRFLIWYDSNLNYINYESYKGSLTEDVYVYLQEVTAPENAAYARVNAYKSYSYLNTLNIKKDITFQGLYDEQQKVNTLLGIPQDSVKALPTYMSSSGVFMSSSIGYEHAAIKVTPGERFKLDNPSNSAFLRYAFATTDEYSVDSIVPLVSGTSVQRVANGGEIITIPDGCSWLLVNYNNYYGSGYKFNARKLEDASGGDEPDDVSPYIDSVIGKNLINPNNLLYGWTWSSDDGYHQRTGGIMSNKMLLSPGKYTIQGVNAYSVDTARICWFNDDDSFIRADKIELDANNVGTYYMKCTSDWFYTYYARIVLQYNTSSSARLFNPETAQFERGQTATTFEACQTEKVPNPAFGHKSKHIFMTGASISMRGNGWFENACDRLGYTHKNVAVSGESIIDAANKLWRGTLFTGTQFERTDVLVLSHVHDKNVASTTSTGVLQGTVAQYEARCYNSSGVYQEGVTPDPTDSSQYLIPPAGYTTTERYSAAFDYVLKKYAAMCYACKDDSTSRYYGTKSGKPFNVIICSYWHDARVTYNTAAKTLCERHGALYCDFAGQVGFSYHQTDPSDANSVRQSALYCNNSAYGGSNDTTTETINGVEYTGLGWHPTRDHNSYLTKKLGGILADRLLIATTND